MIIRTSTFGDLEVQEDKIIFFKDGIPGFEDIKRYVIIILEQTQPFMWLQAVDEDISLPVLNPFDIDGSYSPVVDDSAMEELDIVSEEELLVLVVSVIPKDVNRMSANMAAPILVNTRNSEGRQVLTEDNKYMVRHPIFEFVSQQMHGR